MYDVFLFDSRVVNEMSFKVRAWEEVLGRVCKVGDDVVASRAVQVKQGATKKSHPGTNLVQRL